jgi:hypothetical protein
VLEQLAFMFAEPAGRDAFAAPDGEWLALSMGFSGPLSGALQLAVPPGLCVALAANMLGMDDDDEEAADKGLDAMKEVLNVTCGNILTELAGTEPVFTLTIPEVKPLDAPGWADWLADPAAMGFLIDEHPALLRFRVEGDIR